MQTRTWRANASNGNRWPALWRDSEHTLAQRGLINKRRRIVMQAASIMDISHVSEMSIGQATVCAARYLNKFHTEFWIHIPDMAGQQRLGRMALSWRGARLYWIMCSSSNKPIRTSKACMQICERLSWSHRWSYHNDFEGPWHKKEFSWTTATISPHVRWDDREQQSAGLDEDKIFEGAVMTSTHPELLQHGQVQARSHRKQLQLMIKQ